MDSKFNSKERNPSVKSSAPGKIILCGEHFVGFGLEAIAIPYKKRVYCEISPNKEANFEISFKDLGQSLKFDKIEATENSARSLKALMKMLEVFECHNHFFKAEIYSDLSIGAGFGSSAAFATAISKALADFENKFYGLDKYGRIEKSILESETIMHLKPSGLDSRITLGEKAVIFKKTNDNSMFSEIELPGFDLYYMVARSEKATSEMIESFISEKQRLGERSFNEIKSKYNDAFNLVRSGLQNKSYESFCLGMQKISDLLKKFPLMSKTQEEIYRFVMSKGASFAKISGAGGGGLLIFGGPIKDLEPFVKFAAQNKLEFAKFQV